VDKGKLTAVGRLGIIALLHKGCVAVLHRVVVGGLGEVDLARLPECLFALLLLGREELGHEGVMALGNVLMPALFHL